MYISGLRIPFFDGTETKRPDNALALLQSFVLWVVSEEAEFRTGLVPSGIAASGRPSGQPSEHDSEARCGRFPSVSLEKVQLRRNLTKIPETKPADDDRVESPCLSTTRIHTS